VPAQERRDLIAVRRPQPRLVRAVLGEPDGADDPLTDLVREDDPREAEADEPAEGTERDGNEGDQGDPLDGPLTRSGSATLARS
jgi:hypothetical protein